jgi:hypothetical protein
VRLQAVGSYGAIAPGHQPAPGYVQPGDIVIYCGPSGWVGRGNDGKVYNDDIGLNMPESNLDLLTKSKYDCKAFTSNYEALQPNGQPEKAGCTNVASYYLNNLIKSGFVLQGARVQKWLDKTSSSLSKFLANSVIKSKGITPIDDLAKYLDFTMLHEVG